MENDELETKVRHILSFHRGRENPVSRWDLVEKIFGREAAADRSNNNPFDRSIRKVIEKFRDTDLIVSHSGAAGYYLAASYDDIELIADEYVERSRVMEQKARELRRRGAEAFGPQMPLFRVN